MSSSSPTPRNTRFQNLQIALFSAGALLMPAGLVAVGLGWYGAAHARYAYDQFPYLLSGGLLGVCLTTLGGFLYFGGWQAKVAADQRESQRQLVDTMMVLADLVARERLAGSGGGHAAEAGADVVVAGDNPTALHRRDCTLIAQRADLRSPRPTDVGLVPCRVCAPA